MKILLFIDCLSAGGKERRLVELIKSIKKEPGIEVELAVMSDEIHYQDVYYSGIKIHKLKRKYRKDFSIFKRLYCICKDIKPNIIHCWDSMTAIYSVPICILLNIKLVNGMVTDATVKRSITNKVWLRSLISFPFSSIVVGNSNAGLDAYKVPLNKRALVFNGFDFDRISNINDSGNLKKELQINAGLIIGMVANFSRHKDYLTYFSAAQILLKKRKDITFLAIGQGTDSDASRNMINNTFLDQFKLLGPVTNVESLINIMDICVLSTYSEGISNAILEYMALSKPVIASIGGGTAEIVVDNETGFLIPPSDTVTLASKIEMLLDNEKLRNNLGHQGKLRIQKVFSIELMKNKYIAIYRKISAS